jgi:large subunit ribosomal protein L21
MSSIFAIIETGGKQYRVASGDVIAIEKLPATEVKDGKVIFDKVLLVDDGKSTKIGAPYIQGAKVEAEVTEEGRDKKVTVIKFKAKSRYFKKRGHRQPFSKVKIASIK